MMLKTGEGFISFAGFKPAKFKFDDCSFKKTSPAYIENKELLELFTKELEIGEKRRKEIELKLLKNNDDEETIKIKPNKLKKSKHLDPPTEKIDKEGIAVMYW